eukprot:3607762-Rhodomonas_salina.1
MSSFEDDILQRMKAVAPPARGLAPSTSSSPLSPQRFVLLSSPPALLYILSVLHQLFSTSRSFYLTAESHLSSLRPLSDNNSPSRRSAQKPADERRPDVRWAAGIQTSVTPLREPITLCFPRQRPNFAGQAAIFDGLAS